MNSAITRVRYEMLLLLLFIALSGLGCDLFTPDHYDVFIYPNKHDLTHHIYAGRYHSAEEARDVALEYMEEYPDGDYEIGKNRKGSVDVGVYEETFK
ncbi:MAG: hypothetical protein QME44_01175 [Thermodesulfobacteriota bacterium]|nr:hypothetical protein [Thermodesulfobacteriota bacterium]